MIGSIKSFLRRTAASQFLHLCFVYAVLSFTALELTEKSADIPSDVQEDFFLMTASNTGRVPKSVKRAVKLTDKEVARYLATRLKDSTTEEIKKLTQTIQALCKQHQLNPKFILAVMRAESGFNPWAVSPKGALGLMQVMPDTGAWIARRVGVEWAGPLMLFDPVHNVTLGIKYLAFLRSRYGADMKAVLSAYNAGPAKFERDFNSGNGYRLSYYHQVRKFLVGDLR